MKKKEKSTGRRLPKASERKIVPIEQRLTEERMREIREAFYRARYGEDAQLPLFWAIELLFHSNQKACRYNLAPKNICWESTDIEWDQKVPPTKLESLPMALLFDWVAIAILHRNAKFFDEIARILRERIITSSELGSPYTSPDEHILLAYVGLKEVGKEPTKKQVREKAKTDWATFRIIKMGPLPFNGVMPLEQAVSIAKEKLPVVDWTRAFRRCGLQDLPNDKSGRPRGRSRR